MWSFILGIKTLIDMTWELIEVVAVIVAGSTGISLFLRNTSKNPVVQFFLNFINFLAGNIFRNKNKPDPTPPEPEPEPKKKERGSDKEYGGRR